MPSAPLLSFHMRNGLGTYFNYAPSETTGFSAYPTTDIESDGQTVIVTTDVRPGTNSVLIARGVTCECGNNMNEGGSIDLYSQPFSTPPNLVVNDSRVGTDVIAYVTAEPRGSETVIVSFTGAGTDSQFTLMSSDFAGNQANVARRATSAGTVTVTASLNGVASVRSAAVTANAVVDAGRPMGGGTGGGGGTAQESCSTIGGLPLMLAAALLALRRARSS
jgi:FtsP/CotA-like multicopper oxidase with cupredoxin domain